RLNILGGYRRQSLEEVGQFLEANYPWFDVPVNAYLDPITYPPDVWGYGANYIKTQRVYEKYGDAWMGGASFAFTKGINIYASISKTFQFNVSNVGGVCVGNERPV